MPEGKDGRLCARAEGGIMHIVASADEACGFGNVSGDGGFGGAVIDHDKGAANDQVGRDGGE